jgi:hypothetical protein
MQDMFPFAGAQQTYEEAERFYGLYRAGDKLQWITGPGVHGNPGPISNQILVFLVGHLKAGAAVPDADDLSATTSGQSRFR